MTEHINVTLFSMKTVKTNDPISVFARLSVKHLIGHWGAETGFLGLLTTRNSGYVSMNET